MLIFFTICGVFLNVVNYSEKLKIVKIVKNLLKYVCTFIRISWMRFAREGVKLRLVAL